MQEELIELDLAGVPAPRVEDNTVESLDGQQVKQKVLDQKRRAVKAPDFGRRSLPTASKYSETTNLQNKNFKYQR